MFTHVCYLNFVGTSSYIRRTEREREGFDVVSSTNYGVVSSSSWSDIILSQIKHHKY